MSDYLTRALDIAERLRKLHERVCNIGEVGAVIAELDDLKAELAQSQKLRSITGWTTGARNAALGHQLAPNAGEGEV